MSFRISSSVCAHEPAGILAAIIFYLVINLERIYTVKSFSVLLSLASEYRHTSLLDLQRCPCLPSSGTGSWYVLTLPQMFIRFVHLPKEPALI